MTTESTTPQSAEGWFQKGVTLGRAGDNEAAIAAYEQSVVLDPDHFRAWFNLGSRYGKLQQNAKALPCFQKAVELKLSPVKSEIEGKNILLVDDSVVRGTTSKKIINLLKRHGANEVTLAITCPPLRYGCFYGIDFPAPEQLIANGRSTEQIAEWVGANQVVFLDEEDLVEAIEVPELCMACINGQYPTCTDEAEEFQRRRHEHK